MSIRVDIVGDTSAQADAFFNSSENIAANTRFGVEKALWQSGKDVLQEFSRQVLAKDKRGTLYIRRDRLGRGRRHRASAPGQTPANRTGNYRKSRDFSVDGAHQLAVGLRAEYAGYLEIGTSRMKARPGMANSIQASRRNILRNLSTNILDEL